MAINVINIAESLRPWKNCGITHFLGEYTVKEDNEAKRELLPDLLYEDESAQTEQTAFSQRTSGNRKSNNQPVSSSPLSRNYSSTSSLNRTPNGTKEPESNGAHQVCLSQEQWPAIWQSMFAKTRPASILWTYAELGQDLLGSGSKARSLCLRDIIGKLQLPKGTSTFWPPTLNINENEPGFEHDPTPCKMYNSLEAHIFKQGLQELRPKVVVILGARTMELAELQLSLKMPYTNEVRQGIMFVLLPDISTLLTNPGLVDKACVFLKNALHSIRVIFQS